MRVTAVASLLLHGNAQMTHHAGKQQSSLLLHGNRIRGNPGIAFSSKRIVIHSDELIGIRYGFPFFQQPHHDSECCIIIKANNTN
ncbi:hypothetical protein D3C73_1491950 [compost metagenome]